MKSLSTLTNLATSLAQNITSANQALLIQLMNDQHRYLLQKYFDNERTVTTTTVGSQTLTATGSLAANATSLTLTVAWAYPTGSGTMNFSNGDSRVVNLTNGSTSVTWVGGLSTTATTALSFLGMQAYTLPANISKIKDGTVNVGQLKFVPAPIMTRAEWDLINFLPYNSDIPNYFFLYNNQLYLWPIPSTTGNIITFNYKARIADFSTAFLFSDTSGTAYSAGATTFDYQKGTASGSAGGITITGASTPAWSTAFPTGDVTKFNLYFIGYPNKGDGIYYPISTIDSATALTLASPLVNAVASGATYAIAQMPVLSEDFADMIVYGALMTYFSTIVENQAKYKQFQVLYQSKLAMLEDYAGTKTVNVDLGAQPMLSNPNLYYYGNGSST